MPKPARAPTLRSPHRCRSCRPALRSPAASRRRSTPAGRRGRSCAVPAPARRRRRLLQGGKESGQRHCKLPEVRDTLDRRGLAFDPAVDRPGPGVTLGRAPHRQRDRNGQRQKRRQDRQPSLLLLDLQRIARGAGQPHAHVVAETKRPVVPAAEFDRLDREASPFRKLRGDQPAHQRYVEMWPVGMNASDMATAYRL